MAVSSGKGDFDTLASKDTFYDTSEETGSYSMTEDRDLSRMDPAMRAKAEEELRNELVKTEEEIITLRQVLSAKIKHMQELKRKLGITVWKEFVEDMGQGIKNIQESTAYQRTSDALGNIGASFNRRVEEVKKSPAYKAIEEKVGSAYSNVKTKVSGNTQRTDGNFEEALISSGTKSDSSAESVQPEKST